MPGAKATAAFAAAFEAAAKAGGGRVVVPAGRWKTGAVHFRSNCELHLEDGAEVVFSDDPKDFLPAVPTSWEGIECWNYSPLVYAYACTNVAVTGTGSATLRSYEGAFPQSGWGPWADAETAWDLRAKLYRWGAADTPVRERRLTDIPKPFARPHFIQFNRCRGVRIENVRIRESPFWTIHLFLCDGVTLRDVDVRARAINNDGVDIEMTRNVLVEHCRFDQGDDTFVLKAGRNRDGWRLGRPTENVEIRDCRMARAHSFFTVGSEISGGIRNVCLHDCSVGTAGNLFYVKTNRRRGAFVENIRMENVSAGRVEKVCAVETDVLYEWARFPDGELRTTRIGGLALRNVACDEARVRLDVQGADARPVDGIRLENVRVKSVSLPDRVLNARNVTDDGRPVAAARVFTILDFGAKVGADATDAIRAAVRAAARAGGGRVVVPKGTWRTGPLELADGVELHLAFASVLTFADDPARYARPDGSYRPLLSAENARCVRLSGAGRILAGTDGWQSVPAGRRPPVCRFARCDGVFLERVELRNAPHQVVVAADSRNVRIYGVEFIAQVGLGDFVVRESTDGLDVRDCSFRIGDGRLDVSDPSHRLVVVK